MKEPPEERARSTIMRLSVLCDLIGLRVQIGHKTKYGRRAGKEPWEHTRAYLAYYATETDPDEVIGLFEGVDVHSDIEAGRWLLQHDELIPESQV